jgi:hypothetical protein
MQQGDSTVLLPGFSAQFSPPQDRNNSLTRHDDGTHVDTSFPEYQNATPQFPCIPYSASTATTESHNGRTPVIDMKSYCSWPDCRQSHKEYTAGELKFVRLTYIRPRSQR